MTLQELKDKIIDLENLGIDMDLFIITDTMGFSDFNIELSELDYIGHKFIHANIL